jgi:hypothetical protein
MKRLGKLVRMRQVLVAEGYVVRLEFEDNSVKEIDLMPLMQGPIFDELIENPELFNKMTVSGGTLVWPNGADIDPDVLYYELTPASVSEIDPVR